MRNAKGRSIGVAHAAYCHIVLFEFSRVKLRSVLIAKHYMPSVLLEYSRIFIAEGGISNQA